MSTLTPLRLSVSPIGGHRIRKHEWPPSGYTTEMLRLFLMHSHGDSHLGAVGLGREEIAVYGYLGLRAPGSMVLTTDRGSRLEGLVQLAPDTWSSSMLGRAVWSMNKLILAPESPLGTARALIEEGLSGSSAPVDIVTSRIPANDVRAFREVQEAGFRLRGNEVVAIMTGARLPARESPGIRFVPMQGRHFEVLPSIVKDWYRHSFFPLEPGFDPDASVAPTGRLPLGVVSERQQGFLAAEDRTANMVGLIGYSIDQLHEAHKSLRLAHLSFIGFRHTHRAERLLAQINRNALVMFRRQGVDAVTVRLALTGSNWRRILKVLRKAGYILSAPERILHLPVSMPASRWATKGA